MTDGSGLPDLLRQVATGPLPPGFERWEVHVAPAESLPYVEADWRSALILVAAGRVEVTCRAGGHRCFETGDAIWFDGLEVATLANPGIVPLVLIGVRRA